MKVAASPLSRNRLPLEGEGAPEGADRALAA